MARIKRGTVVKKRHKRVLKNAKGYFGSKHILFKVAKQQVMKSWVYAYRDRKQKKREFRKLWITRINAGAHANEISYSQLMCGLRLAKITINRKMLAELAIYEPDTFKELCNTAKHQLKNKRA